MLQNQGGETRLVDVLERLLEITGADLKLTLARCADLVAGALAADKVDAFLYEPERDWLVAVGSSSQPLSMVQRNHGLDVLHVSNGGRVVHVFQTGQTFVTGRLQDDPYELRGIKEVLKLQSKLGVPLIVSGELRGVLMIASQKADFFSAEDVRFAEAVARWVGLVAQRAELLEQATRSAVEQGRRAVAEELITMLAHDLRNYLSPLAYRLGFLRERAAHDRREDDVREIDHGLRVLARLSQMIADILDVARLDQGVYTMRLEALDIGAALHSAAQGLSTPKHMVELRIAEPTVCQADPVRLRQCFDNLLANAFKHAPEGTAVTVTVLRERRSDGEWLRIEVADQGPGVAPEVLPRIFDRLVTGSGREAGIGLGLYLARQIALAHGGDLSIESEPGKGARFQLTLPCARPREAI